MFEKSLYDLIRGLRNHKGNEGEYIQNCLKECRKEVRSQDMDLKATALLKLIYLEMMGHDMSWASFNVLEVMSSPKHHQKRIGYLGAVQSFRPDTDVLMLATNLLKKDLAATSPTTIILPIMTLPHLITPSLANSVLSDLLPRLSHSHSNIRKKTIVTLYRLALVYPETLRAAWPKIKERLMDKDEDPSVTAAIVNVICELGWRRPHDFLPLAPRLFELLVDSGNNWMAIKLIKLFATLTPLEPRLVRKLLPPLTQLIRETQAMSLLYECINGIIQGGIFGSADDVSGREEIATLCVNKLRGMIMINGDPNLKYVALLAFNKIVTTHSHLVAQQEDVILECIDSPDITIRIKALDLVQGMVSSENLVSIVSRLMKQLKASSGKGRQPGASGESGDSDDDAQVNIHAPVKDQRPAPTLPDDYKIDVIRRILDMCSQNNYASLTEFDWYIDVLMQLIRVAPTRKLSADDLQLGTTAKTASGDVSEKVGDELRNVAVKVYAMRGTAVRAADGILTQLLTDTPASHPITSAALRSVSWVMGEYATHLAVPDYSLSLLLQMISRTPSPDILTMAIQAVIKVFALIAGDEQQLWTAERKSIISLLMARIINTFEPLALHPNLEVQERAVEFTELLKLTAEAAQGQPVSTDETAQDAPLLLTQAIPSLFSGWELHSVALGAQQNVPLPEKIDLDEPIHPNLEALLSEANMISLGPDEGDEFDDYYHKKPVPTSFKNEPAINRLPDAPEDVTHSYQQAGEEDYLDADIVARRKAERLERHRDDPFYIGDTAAEISNTRTSTPIHNILKRENGPELDIDAIPIMQLDLGKLSSSAPRPQTVAAPKPRQKVIIAADETLGGSGTSTPAGHTYESENNSDGIAKPRGKKPKQGLLGINSSGLGLLSLDGPGGSTTPSSLDYERQQREEAEMAKAMKEVERLRLEMQRANERIQVAQGVDAEGAVVKKKVKKVVKKKKTPVASGEGEAVAEGGAEGAGPAAEGEVAIAPKKKKKKKRVIDLQEETTA